MGTYIRDANLPVELGKSRARALVKVVSVKSYFYILLIVLLNYSFLIEDDDDGLMIFSILLGSLFTILGYRHALLLTCG